MQSNVKIETTVYSFYHNDITGLHHNGLMIIDADDVFPLLPGFDGQTDDYMQCVAVGVEGLSTDTYDTQADLVRDLVSNAFDYQRAGYTIQRTYDMKGDSLYVITVFRKV